MHFANSREFRSWVKRLRGARTFTYDIAFLRQDDGSVVGTPLVLLPGEVRRKVDPVWEKWVREQQLAERQRQAIEVARQKERDRLQSLERIARYQSESDNQSTQTLDRRPPETWRVFLQPNGISSLGIASRGIQFSVGPQFSVGSQFSTGPLYQSASVLPFGATTSIDVTASNSQAANRIARSRYPGYRVTGIYKLRYRDWY